MGTNRTALVIARKSRQTQIAENKMGQRVGRRTARRKLMKVKVMMSF